MKKLFGIIFLMTVLTSPVLADTQQTQVPPVSFVACQKSFEKPSEPFFYLVLSSIAKNNYKIVEIQSHNGLIIFKAYNKEFLANITKINSKTSLLKITPTDNNYSFSYFLIDNLFKTIALDASKDIYKIN